jgi:hypothetical protein
VSRKRSVAEIAGELEQVILDVGASYGDDEAAVKLRAKLARELLKELDKPPEALEEPAMPAFLEPGVVRASLAVAQLRGYGLAQRRCIELLLRELPYLTTSARRPTAAAG